MDLNLARRRSGALLMSMIAIASLFFRRVPYDVMPIMLFELSMGAAIVGLLSWLCLRSKRRTESTTELNTKPWIIPLVSLLVLNPWLVDFVGRSFGGGNGRELQMLGSLAWGSLAAAVIATTSRAISISVICSGFLTLFATFISDSGQATWFAYLWGILCLWWLVSNHWESIECQAAIQVKTSGRHRIFSLASGCLIFLVVTAMISERIPVLRKIKAELMPTSGGTTAKDSVGRGIGNGDALVAARNHPTSFGAVETDMFLESPKPSLFDVVSEELGAPRSIRRTQRAQGLDQNQSKVKAGNFSEANQSSSGSDFSTQRSAPKTREKPNNIVSESLMFWAGSSAAHLAVERFSAFDGVVWSNPAKTKPVTPLSLDVDGQTWFYASERVFPNPASPFVDTLPESLKFTRFRSPVVPTRCGLQMWCIDLLDRADFFGVDSNGLVSMPDREHVPEYTVVRMINSRIDRERVEQLLERAKPVAGELSLPESCRNQIDLLCAGWTKDVPRGFEQVKAIIEGLRSHFEYDRQWTTVETPESPVPLQQFLESRRGPSYLFATAATQLLRRLGYETRLTTGFYVNSKHYLSAEREIGILPQDAHVWLELRIAENYWIPLEPTPGFQSEPLSVGWWYSVKKARYAIAQTVLLILATGLLLHLTKGLLLEIISQAAWPLMALVSDRNRVVWLARLLDLRSRLAGMPRQKSLALRAHLRGLRTTLPGEIDSKLDVYCQAADRLCFGGDQKLTQVDQQAICQLWRHLTYFRIRQAQRRSAELRTNPVGTAT
jgi:protein-glutamine gamma-glutamyltransferase